MREWQRPQKQKLCNCHCPLSVMNTVNAFLSDPETNRAILRHHPTEEPINHYRYSLQITDTNVDMQKLCKQLNRALKRTKLDSTLLWPKMDCSLLWLDTQYGHNGWNVIYSWQKTAWFIHSGSSEASNPSGSSNSDDFSSSFVFVWLVGDGRNVGLPHKDSWTVRSQHHLAHNYTQSSALTQHPSVFLSLHLHSLRSAFITAICVAAHLFPWLSVPMSLQ